MQLPHGRGSSAQLIGQSRLRQCLNRMVFNLGEATGELVLPKPQIHVAQNLCWGDLMSMCSELSLVSFKLMCNLPDFPSGQIQTHFIL